MLDLMHIEVPSVITATRRATSLAEAAAVTGKSHCAPGCRSNIPRAGRCLTATTRVFGFV